MSAAPVSLFAYGTLQLPEVLHAVVGRRWQGEPALLVGYARYRVRGKTYPAIVAEPAGNVAGLLYGGVDAEELALLDRYEGELYEHRTVNVRVGGGAHPALAYVLGEQHRSLLSGDAWELGEFEREHLAGYLQQIALTRRAP
jgi:gamma-glutamylcyclotransferase (GGCT)/AIG2-like uncharacterized protein YtfP